MQEIESFFAPLVKRKQEWEIMENQVKLNFRLRDHLRKRVKFKSNIFALFFKAKTYPLLKP